MVAQPTLFESNAAHLERVRGRVEPVILDYVRQHRTFHAADLQAYVNAQAGPIAPDSSARILRSMRTRGLLDYRVANRRASLYEVERVA